MWFEVENTDNLLSPALLVCPEIVERNISKMISMTGSADRLRPHVKTYKSAKIIGLQQAQGIQNFKCATLAEAILLGEQKAEDVLWAMPLSGPNQSALASLAKRFPHTRWSALVDHDSQIEQWVERANSEAISLFIDVDMGMNRTGVPIDGINDLIDKIKNSGYELRGFHCYDGHIHDVDPDLRSNNINRAFERLNPIADQNPELEWICGGSISFPIHAEDHRKTLSPGTTMLWDEGYSQYEDLNFEIAACLATRVISKPGNNLICLDLGYKAVASEMNQPRVVFPQLENCRIKSHSEEHMVVSIPNAQEFEIGQMVYAIPWHICPTVALYPQMHAVANHQINETWAIDARNRIYHI